MTKFLKAASWLAVMFAFCLITGCSRNVFQKKQQALPKAYVNAPLTSEANQLQVSASIMPQDTPPGRIADAIIRERAEKLAMKPLLREFIAAGHQFRLSDAPPPAEGGVLFRFLGPAVAQPDPETDELVQDFHFRAVFSNSLDQAGVIVGFDKGQVIAGDNDVALVRKVRPKFHPHSPAYALIAKPTENDPTMFRVFGSARFRQDLGDICQIEILEAHSEIMAGAVVLFVGVRAEAVNRVYASSTPAGPSNQETITVAPVKEQAAPKQPVIPK